MDEKKIISIVQQEIQNSKSGSRFGINPIPRHIHNNIDSPNVFQPIITYVGQVTHDGIGYLLPKGWSVAEGSPGTYIVTHNLSPGTLYSVNAIPSADSGTGHDSISYSGGFNDSPTVSFYVFDTTNGAGSLCDFEFTLTVINNRSQQLPSYSGAVNP